MKRMGHSKRMSNMTQEMRVQTRVGDVADAPPARGTRRMKGMGYQKMMPKMLKNRWHSATCQ